MRSQFTKNSGITSAVLLTIALCFGVTLLILDLRFTICDFCEGLGARIRFQDKESSGTAADSNIPAPSRSNRKSQI